MAIIKTISDLLWGMPLIVLILLAGIIFTVGSKFFQIAHLKHILKNTIGTLFSKKDNGKGMMKPLEVISIAVGGSGCWQYRRRSDRYRGGRTGCSLLDLGCGLFGHDDENGRSFPGGILPFKG